MGKFRALVSDIDGTLVTLPIDWDKLRSKVRETLGINDHLRPLALRLVQVCKDPMLRKKAFQIVEEEEVRASLYTPSTPLITSFLRKLKFQGIKLGVVTLHSSKSTSIILSKLKLVDVVDCVVTRDYSVSRLEQLRKMLHVLKVHPHETVFVGDTIYDVEAGKSLGCFTVIIRNPRYRVESADMYFDHLIEVYELFTL